MIGVDAVCKDNDSEEYTILKGGTTYLLWVSLCSKRLRRTVLSFFLIVLKRFFIDQFAFKLKLGLRSKGFDVDAPTLKSIEHPVDARVPIRYERVKIYLSFIQLWISSIAYLRWRLGPSFDLEFEEFLVGLMRCYKDASSVYSRGLTTTMRPERAPNPRFAFIYAVDPHLFCVPSLHVLVVCYTYKVLDDMVCARGDGERFKSDMTALRMRAIAITESVLYVRQHSVNCIPTALAMLGVMVPSFDEVEAKNFISQLFEDDDGMTAQDRIDVIDYMTKLYDHIVVSGSSACYDRIAEFVASYESTPTPQESLSAILQAVSKDCLEGRLE